MKKKTLMIACLAFGMSLFLAQARAASASTEDQVTLKDGTTLSGQIVEESGNQLIIEVQGSKKTLERSKIAKVSYGNGPSEDTVAAAPSGGGNAVPAAPQGNLVSELAEQYGVREGDVLWVRRQGITDADLPMVFYVAANAQVQTKVVVRLRLERWTWNQIEAHFGLKQDGVDHVLVEPYPYVVDPYPVWGWGWGWGGYGGWHGGWHHWR